MTTPTTQREADERVLFEQDLRAKVHEASGDNIGISDTYADSLIRRAPNGDYQITWVDSKWEGWYARAALAQSEAPAPEAPATEPCDCCKDIRDAEAIHGDGPADTTASADPEGDFAKGMLFQLARMGASPAALSLAVQLFGVGPCEKCGYRKLHCRCAPAQQTERMQPSREDALIELFESILAKDPRAFQRIGETTYQVTRTELLEFCAALARTPLPAREVQAVDVARDAWQTDEAIDPVVEANRKLLLNRSRVGVAKYGVTLSGAGLARAELVQHALEEALDLANYLQTILQLDRATQFRTNTSGGSDE